ncbi:MAG: WYL domain-containing protein [Myxococcota bacterium]
MSLPADLSRFLFLVPFVAARPEGVSVAELADMLSMSADALRRLIERVAMVGAPDGGPDELVEIYLEGDRVFVALTQRFTRPPRFSVDEMTALLLALAPLQDLPVLREQAKALSDRLVALATKRASELAPAFRSRLVAGLDSDDDPHVLRTLEEALAAKRCVSGRYYTAGRDAVSERTLAPAGLLQVRGRWYVADASEKVFRVDRFESLALTDEAAPPADVNLSELRQRLERMQFGGSAVKVRIDGEVRTIESFASEALRRWIRLHRGRIELMGPDDKRCLIAAEAAELAQLYGSKPSA